MSAPLCEHPTFEAHVTVNRIRVNLIEDTKRFVADVQVRCAVCRVRFRWLGFDRGIAPDRAMVSVDEFELRAPIEPDAHLTSLMAESDTGFPVEKADAPPNRAKP